MYILVTVLFTER